MGKKYPWYAYAVVGAVLAIGGLYFWGKYSMKNDGKKAPVPAPPVTDNATSDKKTLAGGVLRFS
jgi:hypothetical protein